MNPYLEQPGLWPQVHNRLVVAIADALTPQIAPKYRVSIEERVYTTTDPLPLVGIADVAMAERQTIPQPLATAALLPTPRQVPLPIEVTERCQEEPDHHSFCQVLLGRSSIKGRNLAGEAFPRPIL